MKNFLCLFIGLLFLVSSMLASENSLRKLNSRLRHSAGSGTVAACEKLLAQGAAINGRGQGGATPLYIASQKGNSDVVKFLLSNKALVNATCDLGASPLYVACQDGHGEVVQLLLESKALVNATRSTGATPLFVSSLNGHIEVVRLLLGSSAQVDTAKKDGATPLFIACQNGHDEVVKLLLDSKAQADSLRNDGTAPLSIARQRGHSKVISLLLQSKVQPDKVQVSPAGKMNSKELDSLLRQAAGRGQVAACKKLLSQGALLNGRGHGGETPLCVASEYGHGEVVKFLLETKAQVDVACDGSETPLFMASQEGYADIVRLLLENNAQVDRKRSTGATPLFIASQNGHVEVAKVLLGSKSQVDTARDSGATPLIIACQEGHGVICQLLIGNKAAIDKRTRKNKSTALHSAVCREHLDCVTFLLKGKADVTVCDSEGDTPLVYAANQRNRELCILLSSYGAEIKVPRVSMNKNRKKLAMYVQSVLSSDEGGISNEDSDYQSINHLVSSNQGVSRYSAVPTARPPHYEQMLSTLHTVAQEGDCGKLEMIFGFDVPVDLLNDEGYTALQLAVLAGHYEMCSELLRYGAERNRETPDGETAIQIAQRAGRPDLVELFKKIPEPEQGAVSSTDVNH